MNTPHLVHWFEIPATDMDRAQKFYEAILDISLDRHEMGESEMAWFPMEKGAAGASGTLMKHESAKPSLEGTMVYFSVDDIEGTLKKIEEAGGKTLQEKMSIGEHGFIAHFRDTEGNRVSLHSMK